MKVYIVHPNYDYGVESVHATREGAEAHMKRIEEEQWENYRSLFADGRDGECDLDRSAFINAHYIHEIEVTT